MIKGKAKLEFGTGDIRVTGIVSEGIGALVMETWDVPHEIGEKEKVEEGWNTINAEAIMSFTKIESIDVVIEDLKDIKAIMLNEYPKRELKTYDHGFDLDSFMWAEEKRSNGDWIRSMDDETLAKIFPCPESAGLLEQVCNHDDNVDCHQCILHYLQEETDE
ncbi:MAG: hypothetical protein PHQ72_14725 [Hespellia sp.]|nr:hypothetical protein [Hespellia sp.]